VRTLDLTSIELPTAPIHSVSPLPMLNRVEPIGNISTEVPAEIVERASAGYPPSLLPYQAEDDYDRELSPIRHRVAILENEWLRATVALDLGGRLLSLLDRRSDRELLYVNPVVQPANLALRNAWFSGGVEWNIGTRGHAPTTMDTLHAASVDGPDGGPMLRLWEWERIRNVVFRIDLWLPESTPVLLASTRIRNVNDTPTPMYWWTNAAVVVRPDTRVLAPAIRAFRTQYPDRLGVAAIPGDGYLDDVTFPSRHVRAADFFFEIASVERPWIAAVNGDGTGIAHVSTSRLRGRKLFVWGSGSGGSRWQQWLSHGGKEIYAEIQAGLAPTQFEHMTMRAGAEWSWTEAFGAIAVDVEQSHGSSWTGAVSHVSAAIDGLVPADHMDEWHRVAGTFADRPPQTWLSTGSGWGALERLRRESAGEPWFDDSGTPFPDDSLGPDQQPWLDLLRTGAMPSHAREEPPGSYVTGIDWEARLEAAPPSWLTDYHRAVLAHGRGDRRVAAGLYESSSRIEPNAWAVRGLAEVARADGRLDDAADHAVAAARMTPSEWRLAIEAISRLLDASRPREALRLFDELPAEVRERGRLRLLAGWAAHQAGDVDRARAVLEEALEVADLREGERSIDALWTAVFPDRPIPADYDFRLT
jgi:Domain of unknown function (DUF5107)